MKKISFSEGINDKRNASEYTLIKAHNERKFFVISGNKRDPRRLEIPFEEFCFPQFCQYDKITKEIKDRIEDYYDEKNIIIIVLYSEREEEALEDIELRNKINFE